MIQVSGNGNGHKRAVLYLRVSTDEQKENGYGLIGQVDDCKDYAARLGFEIVKEFQEDYTGFSRFADRPVGREVMEFLKTKQADAVLVARVDRIARDSLEARIAARDWLKSGIELHTAKNGHIKNDNDIVFLIETWQGQEDYTKIVKIMRDGRNNKARTGNVVGNGRAPFGYQFIRNDKGKVIGLEIDLATGGVVRLIFTWYVYGDESGKPLTLWAIGGKLTAMHIPTPAQLRDPDLKPEKRGFSRKNARTGEPIMIRGGVWAHNSVSNILHNEVYAGVWR